MASDDALKTRLDWLESEHRKTSSILQKLQDQVVSLEGDYRAASEQLKALSAEVSEVKAALTNLDRLEERISKVEAASAAHIDEVERSLRKSLSDTQRALHDEIEALREPIGKFSRKIETLSSLQQAIERRAEEVQELRRALDALTHRVEENERAEDDRRRALQLVSEGQERLTKRVIDLQGEVTAFRKRLDEQSAAVKVFEESLRKMEARLQDLAAAEQQRKRQQTEFIEEQNRHFLRWENTWKGWEERFGALEELSKEVEDRLRAWDELQREVKRAQERFEAMTERMDRRVAEISEMQRLAEDRFRQEWNAFKADDQKRWANYLLTQEERGRDLDRRLSQLADELTTLRDGLQEVDDLVRLTDEQVRKRLQSLAALAHDWMNEYDRIMGALREEG